MSKKRKTPWSHFTPKQLVHIAGSLAVTQQMFREAKPKNLDEERTRQERIDELEKLIQSIKTDPKALADVRGEEF